MTAATRYERLMSEFRLLAHRYSTRVYGPSPWTSIVSWIGSERLAVGNLPTAASLPRLVREGVTHVVNCRALAQTWVSQDLFAEKEVFGAVRVVHAPMWDFGQPQPATLWSSAAVFAATALDDPGARVLVHCQQGRRRSVLVAYAVLRLRGYGRDKAAELILAHRREAQVVPAYQASVEEWLSGLRSETSPDSSP